MGPGSLEEKTITVVYGTDFVNIHFLNFCTRKQDVAEVRDRERETKIILGIS